ncbi:uncharacterized protein LOC143725553 isoform X2 [Siphateles boraxobius]|uniref:uncharacterized protein LOC143725553 isoform X2 n=1 Tax=Siphateles boraxobius TaxID=180520 RepID=UPI004064809A
MITVVWLFFATGAVHVAGSKLEATEGQNASIFFQTGLERIDEVRIIFEGERKGKLLLAHYCSPDADPICDPIETPQHVQVKGGNVSLTLVKVNSSSSGLYTAQVITDNKVFYVNDTLVVNQAPVSSTTAPPHSSSSPKPSRSSDLRGLYALITAVIIIIILCVCFCKHRMILCFKRKNWDPVGVIAGP